MYDECYGYLFRVVWPIFLIFPKISLTTLMIGVAIGFASREKNDEKNENVKKKETSAEREMMFLMEDNASESEKKLVTVLPFQVNKSRQVPFFRLHQFKSVGQKCNLFR